MNIRRKLLTIYNRLHKRFGPRHWWPADTAFEVVIGAILTQNTSWKNVEKAIVNLKKRSLLSPSRLSALSNRKLASLIRPAGYYNIKAKRLKNFLKFLSEEFDGSLKKAFKLSTRKLREKLLAVNGIGKETADSILLYAANRPVFVIDAYTKRMLLRHNMIKADASYDDMQNLITENLPRARRLFNEYHALIVELGKEHCRPNPRCTLCPLKKI